MIHSIQYPPNQTSERPRWWITEAAERVAAERSFDPMTSIPDHGPDPAEAPERSLRVIEAAAILRVDPRTVTRWADAGKLACTRTLGGVTGRGHRRFAETDIRALLIVMRGVR